MGYLQRTSYSVIICLILYRISVESVELPAPLSKCHIKDEKCLKEQAEKFISANAKGIPEFDIPTIDPQPLGDLSILGKNSSASLSLSLSNMYIYGTSVLNVTDFRGFSRDTTKPMKIRFDTEYDQLILKAKYKVDGKVLLFPIRGEGDIELVMSGVQTMTRLLAELKKNEQDGKTYLKVKKLKLDTKITHVKVNMTNLFNGDKVLSENILKVINDNWTIFSEDISPALNEKNAIKNSEIIGKFCDRVPYDDFFLPDE